MSSSGRSPTPEDEVKSAVKKVFASKQTAFAASSSRKATFQPEILAAVAGRLEGFDGTELVRRSTVDPKGMPPSVFLHALYRPGENVLCFKRFKSQGEEVWTRPPAGETYNPQALDAFINPEEGDGSWFLANPVSGAWADLPTRN